ncbi:MAG: hypothetical protein ABI818_12380 [Acidobacteriota bacterium]
MKKSTARTLQHRIAALVDWAEHALMEGQFDERARESPAAQGDEPTALAPIGLAARPPEP